MGNLNTREKQSLRAQRVHGRAGGCAARDALCLLGKHWGVSVGLCLLCALFLAMKALRPVFTDLIMLFVHLWWWYFERCHKEWGQPGEVVLQSSQREYGHDLVCNRRLSCKGTGSSVIGSLLSPHIHVSW